MKFQGEILLVDPATLFLGNNWIEFVHNPSQFPKILGFTDFATTKLQILNSKFELEVDLPFYNDTFKTKLNSKSGMMCIFLKSEVDAFCSKNFISQIFNYPMGSFDGDISVSNALFSEPAFTGKGDIKFKLKRI